MELLKKKAPRRFPLAEIRGYVQISGNPKIAESLQGAVAYVRAEGATEWTDADFVDASGNFTLPAETNGNYEVMLTAKGCEDQTIQVTIDGLTGDANVTLNPTGIEDGKDIIVRSHQLFRAYPNPFNPTTTIKYQVPELSFVTLKVYDVLGNEIARLMDEEKVAGSYEIEFDAAGLPSGIYFYRLQSSSFVETKKMILMK